MTDQIAEKYSAEAVANFFIQKGVEDGITNMTQMKIQKLVYFGLGWCLCYNKTDIIGGEEVEAWEHGPVIPSLYHSLKHYGSNNITQPIPGYFSAIDENGDAIGEPEPASIPVEDAKVLKTLESVWSAYKNKSAVALREITHKHSTPWKMHYKPNNRNVEIPKETIKAFYEVLRSKASA